MPDWLASLPLWGVYLILCAASMVRGQTLYWLGRWVSTTAPRSTLPGAATIRRKLSSDSAERAAAWVRRWGWPAVPLAHLTVGVQTVVMATCGAVRMRWPVFLAAQIPGSLAWALIYSTVGWVAWKAIVWAAMTSPWGFGLGVVVLVVAVVWWRRRAAHTPGAGGR